LSKIDYKDNFKELPKQIDYLLREDYDHLIILDGCRYDDFRDINDIDGNLEAVYSPAGRTFPWIEAVINKYPKLFKDFICVSGSQFLATEHSKFKDLRNCIVKDWDDEVETISARGINHGYKVMRERYPLDKFLIWYMQPHVPFIGENMITHKEMGWKLGDRWLLTIEKMVERFGLVQTRNAYRDNIKYVINHVREILPTLDGTVIITSDHGNGFGEPPRRFIGHEKNLDLWQLRSVPWLRIELEELEL
jgi:hypothetical protein